MVLRTRTSAISAFSAPSSPPCLPPQTMAQDLTGVLDHDGMASFENHVPPLVITGQPGDGVQPPPAATRGSIRWCGEAHRQHWATSRGAQDERESRTRAAARRAALTRLPGFGDFGLQAQTGNDASRQGASSCDVRLLRSVFNVKRHRRAENAAIAMDARTSLAAVYAQKTNSMATLLFAGVAAADLSAAGMRLARCTRRR